MQRVGMDLVEIEEVRDSIRTFGERYLRRVFTPAERDECGGSPARLAERFAAKEAILKALDVDGATAWAAIDTRAQGPAGLAVRLSGQAAQLAGRRGVDRISVSVSHRRGHALAVAIAEAG